MVRPEILTEITQKLQIQLDWDLCCDPEGHNSQAANFCSKNEPFWQKKPTAGWCQLNPPYSNMKKIVRSWQQLKAENDQLGALLWLPKWEQAGWWHRVANLPVVKEFPKGT